MTLFLFCLVLALAGTNVFTLVKFNQIRDKLELGPSTRKGLTSSRNTLVNSKHKLKKTFVDRNITRNKEDQDFYGWHFWCECGAIAPAVDNNTNYTSIEKGTESGAVRAWRKHADLYSELVDTGDSELEKCKKELEEQKANCICKDL